VIYFQISLLLLWVKLGTKSGEKPRKFVIGGKTYYVSEKAKRLIQSIVRDTKEKLINV
jgi:hypothetical protein